MTPSSGLGSNWRHPYLCELSSEAVEIWDLGRVANRDHIRSKAYQFSIPSVQIDVYVMRSVRQNPGYARKIRKCGGKGPRDLTEEDVGLERPKRQDKEAENRESDEIGWESVDNSRKSNAGSHLVTRQCTIQGNDGRDSWWVTIVDRWIQLIRGFCDEEGLSAGQ